MKPEKISTISESEKDPVCGMTVNPKLAKGKSIFKGQAVYFCSLKCKTKFDQDPVKYLSPKLSPSPTKDDAEVAYACPMHPEIRQIGPGSCPICGMALEPVMARAEDANDSELKLMFLRFWVSLAFSLPLLFCDNGRATPL